MKFAVEENATIYGGGLSESWKMAKLTICQTQYGPDLKNTFYQRFKYRRLTQVTPTTDYSKEGRH